MKRTEGKMYQSPMGKVKKLKGGPYIGKEQKIVSIPYGKGKELQTIQQNNFIYVSIPYGKGKVSMLMR